MEVRRAWGPSSGPNESHGRPVPAHEELRRSVRSTIVATGTLACRRCDAPVGIGDSPASLIDELSCPFCGHGGPLRDFLSLAVPTRPARVVIRISDRARIG